jgi:release factor glutamine methyltransferase
MTDIVNVAAAIRMSGLPELEAQILLGSSLGVDRAWLIAHARDGIAADAAASFQGLCERRRNGEPIAYLVGVREFYGLTIAVTPAVLIPRPETELLVDLALERLPENAPAAAAPSRVLDLGAGSGCVALAIAKLRSRAAVVASDVSGAALDVARANAVAVGADVRWIESDWYSAVGDTRFDMIVSNPPYIADGDHHLREGDLRFEPPLALTGGGDGWSAIDIIVAGAGRHLNTGGWLLFEHGYDQAEGARARLEAAGFAGVQSWRDLAGIARVSGGRLGTAAP